MEKNNMPFDVGGQYVLSLVIIILHCMLIRIWFSVKKNYGNLTDCDYRVFTSRFIILRKAFILKILFCEPQHV